MRKLIIAFPFILSLKAKNGVFHFTKEVLSYVFIRPFNGYAGIDE